MPWYPGAERILAEPALDAAERELRAVEALMSTWIESTEISRLNRAKAGGRIALSAPSLEVLRAAQRLKAETGGAFDVTCRPLIELWRSAGRRDTLPSPEEIETARRASSWEGLVLEEGGARKLRDTVRVDLGGIAKGYAIDRALEAMVAAGVVGALVDVGGDLRCSGRSPMEGSAHWQRAFLEVHPKGWPWSIEIQSPFGSDPQGSLRIREGAVCTSGGYARFVEIDGQRYSHIVDPRTGRPADELTSVTVIAPDALTADAWATALSILGPEGFALLGDSPIRALLVRGPPESLEVFATAGDARLSSKLAGTRGEPIRPTGGVVDGGLEVGLDALGQLFVGHGGQVLGGGLADEDHALPGTLLQGRGEVASLRS